MLKIIYISSSLQKYVFDHQELGKQFLLFQHLPQGIFDLFVPQTVEERVQHGDQQRTEHRHHLSLESEWLEQGGRYVKRAVPSSGHHHQV